MKLSIKGAISMMIVWSPGVDAVMKACTRKFHVLGNMNDSVVNQFGFCRPRE
jgi:hypothetical protein